MADTFQPSDYASFDYVSYSVSNDGSRFVGRYALSGPGRRVEFSETITIPGAAPTQTGAPLHRLLFLACGLSYYKAAAPTVVHVESGLTDRERDFLCTLISNGLGEFAYRNQLPDSLYPTIEADHLTAAVSADEKTWSLAGAPLVPVGGGKDSVVTLESIKRIGKNPIAFSVNRFDPIDACIDVSGCERVHATRALDRKLVELNQAGAYNGHVPVTAINSLIAVLVADSLSLGPVAMSNEGSAEYGNLEWNGTEINHQWSKSLAFERLLRAALESAGLAPDRYFSLLRPLSELAIAKRFVTLDEYFPAFTSCNRLFTIDVRARRISWCCRCPKCQFVFLILAPFLSPAVLESIFGENLLDNPDNRGPYQEILGLTGHKPFECVGDYDEARAALRMAAEHDGWRATVLLPELVDAVDRITPSSHAVDMRRLLGDSGLHVIPAGYQEALRAIG